MRERKLSRATHSTTRPSALTVACATINRTASRTLAGRLPCCGGDPGGAAPNGGGIGPRGEPGGGPNTGEPEICSPLIRRLLQREAGVQRVGVEQFRRGAAGLVGDTVGEDVLRLRRRAGRRGGRARGGQHVDE